MINTLSKLRKYLIPAAVGLGLFGLGYVGGTVRGEYQHEQCHAEYVFINADVVCDKKPVIKKTGYVATKNKIIAFAEAEKAAGRLTELAFYFRDLENGPVFGINEAAEFAPASLLKLPLALVYLTQAERDPNILNEQLSVAEPQWNFSQHFPSGEAINPSASHTVLDLLTRMLAFSDNNAYGVLLTHLYESGQKEIVAQTFLELGFIDPADIYDETLNVRQYAGIFRGLYNASYLNAELSEKALEWLAQSDFGGGLRAGVPMHITVAHKFGERNMADGTKQLHDCGIVYYPDNPYLLCVMTKGKDFDELLRVISHISLVIYTEVDSRRLR